MTIRPQQRIINYKYPINHTSTVLYTQLQVQTSHQPYVYRSVYSTRTSHQPYVYRSVYSTTNIPSTIRLQKRIINYKHPITHTSIVAYNQLKNPINHTSTVAYNQLQTSHQPYVYSSVYSTTNIPSTIHLQ